MARILITSALPYINGVKHLGNLAGSMLPADVYARYCRAAGHEVLFICATDEHGTPAELAAIEAGQTTAEYCDEQHDIQKRSAPASRLSFDWFGRSSNPPNRKLTQHFCEVLEKQRPDRGAHLEAGLLRRRQALPAGPLCRGHLPQLRLRESARRPVRQLRNAARSRSSSSTPTRPSPARAMSRSATRATSICCRRRCRTRSAPSSTRAPPTGRTSPRPSPTNGSTKA